MSTSESTNEYDNLAPGSVKAAMKDAGASSGDLWMVPPEQLRVISGFNVRVHNKQYEEHIEWIKSSIIANGFYRDEPLTGYVAKEDGENVIYVTDGHTRLEAVQRAIQAGHEIKAVPVIVKPNGTSIEDLTVDLVTKNSGKPLTPIETATVIKRLLGYGWDEKQVAERLGYTKVYVKDLLLLLGAPAAVRKLVESGKVAATLAISEVKKDPKQAAQKLTQAAEKVSSEGKAKVTKKSLGEPKKKPIVAEVRAPYMDNEGQDFIVYLLTVPRDRADEVDAKRVKLTVVGDLRTETPVQEDAPAESGDTDEL